MNAPQAHGSVAEALARRLHTGLWFAPVAGGATRMRPPVSRLKAAKVDTLRRLRRTAGIGLCAADERGVLSS